jgi:hypothetical protein
MIRWFGRWCVIDTRLGPGALLLPDATARAPAVDGDTQALIKNSDEKMASNFAFDMFLPFPRT